MPNVLQLTSELIRRRSVTPDDGGCQALLAARLQSAGFRIEHLPFGAVSNLWATHGSGTPVFVFLGHTDVVPSGPESAWTSPPFQPDLRDGMLYGRGVADMKGSVAAMTIALQRFVAVHGDHRGTIALLLTSDEEGEGKDGIRRVVETFRSRGQGIDYCLVGEPSARQRLGDTVRVGRRGSLHGRLVVHGMQGHVAYPDRARNPIHAFAPALVELSIKRWDEGNEWFPATTFQVSNLHSGEGAANVIPGTLTAEFNFRFGTASSVLDLQKAVEAILDARRLDYTLEWDVSGEPFVTRAGRLREAVSEVILQQLGIEPVCDTGGGTSDGRFVAALNAEIVEFGPINASIHKLDEHVRVDDLHTLVDCYGDILARCMRKE